MRMSWWRSPNLVPTPSSRSGFADGGEGYRVRLRQPRARIYPHVAKAAGAHIVATGRGDFPNQVNNSVCFPSILKGTLLVSARKITDEMAVCAAHAIADFAERQGITTEHIMPTMMDSDLFPEVAAAVGECAVRAGLARTHSPARNLQARQTSTSPTTPWTCWSQPYQTVPRRVKVFEEVVRQS